MLEFNKNIKQGDLLYSQNSITPINNINGSVVNVGDNKRDIEIDNIRKVEISYLTIYMNIIEKYIKEGFDNVIVDLYCNVGLSDFTGKEFRDFYKTNTSTDELYKHIKYVSFTEQNDLGLTTHPLIYKYLETFNLTFEDNIPSSILKSIMYGMDDNLYGDLFKAVTEPTLIYKDTVFVTDDKLRRNKIEKVLKR